MYWQSTILSLCGRVALLLKKEILCVGIVKALPLSMQLPGGLFEG